MNLSTIPRRRVGQAIGTAFLGAAALQFARRDLFIALVPEQLGNHPEAVQATMATGLGVMGATFFQPRLRTISRWSTTAMLVASLPAALDQIRHPEQMHRLGLPTPLVIARVPAQIGMLAAIWYATADETARLRNVD